jgi:hypothetical protein
MIQPSFPYQGSPRVAGTPTPPAPNGDRASIASLPSSDHLSFSGSESLRAALAATPEIRPEVVAEGRHLAIDPNYPPLRIIEELAKVLIQSADPSEQV